MDQPVLRQLRLRATYMRGGTSKGVFFEIDDLPEAARQPGALRDKLLMRLMGSPDPYRRQIDGMGGATSSTSKVVLISPSHQTDCDVDYLFGQVTIDEPLVDWTGNCGNLVAAVGPFAIARGLIKPADGIATVRIWQANLKKRIVAHVPVRDGEVVELGEFELDGVTFPAAEIKVEYIDPGTDDGADGSAMFPTGRVMDRLWVEGIGSIDATFINAGNPTIFIAAQSLGLTGTELQTDINGNPEVLARAEAVRAAGAVAMGVASSLEEATRTRKHTPKLAFVAPPANYQAADGKLIAAGEIDLLARIFSMGPLHHAMTGTGAVALAAASAIPGTVVQRVVRPSKRSDICFGHPSGTLKVGATTRQDGDSWSVTKVIMSRSARQLMDGYVLIPNI